MGLSSSLFSCFNIVLRFLLLVYFSTGTLKTIYLFEKRFPSYELSVKYIDYLSKISWDIASCYPKLLCTFSFILILFYFSNIFYDFLLINHMHFLFIYSSAFHFSLLLLLSKWCPFYLLVCHCFPLILWLQKLNSFKNLANAFLLVKLFNSFPWIF